MTSSVDLESLLNPAQLDAVRHPDGPLLVLAGAGSGKTRVLTYRIAGLIHDRGVAPSQILAVTFTNKAAGEMRERLEHLLGPGVARALWIGTFHSIASRILRLSGAALGLDPRFVIYDGDDQRALMREVLRAQNVDDHQYPPAAVLAEISRAKNDLIDHVAYAARAETHRQSVIGRLYAAYQRRLEECHALDFDDLLVRTVELFRQHPDVLARYQARFLHVLVDEYQDTNHSQYVLVNLLAGTRRNLSVVGDDDQAIYRWRGADVRNILEFERDYPDAKVVTLEQNYRSTQRILRAAASVIRHNPHRHAKTLWTENPEGEEVTLFEAWDGYDEARYVGEAVKRYVAAGGRAGDVAVLYRTHAQSRQFEEMFLRLGLPYRIVGGLRFYERAEIKDVLAYLRAAYNPADEASVRRVLNVPRRGIGDATVRRLDAWARAEGISFWDALRRAVDAGVAGPARKAIEDYVGIVDQLAAFAADHPAREVLGRALELTGYRRALEAERTDEAYARVENLGELAAVAQEVRGDDGRRLARDAAAASGARHRCRSGRRPRGSRHADDAAQREGARVSGRGARRARGGVVSARALAGGSERHGRGATALLRRHDPRARATPPDLRPPAHPLRHVAPEPAVALPRRDAGGRGEPGRDAPHGDRRLARGGPAFRAGGRGRRCRAAQDVWSRPGPRGGRRRAEGHHHRAV